MNYYMDGESQEPQRNSWDELWRDFGEYKKEHQNSDGTTLWVNFLLTREDSTMDDVLPRTIEDKIDELEIKIAESTKQGQAEKAKKEEKMKERLQERYNSMFVKQEHPDGYSSFIRQIAPPMDPLE